MIENLAGKETSRAKTQTSTIMMTSRNIRWGSSVTPRVIIEAEDSRSVKLH